MSRTPTLARRTARRRSSPPAERRRSTGREAERADALGHVLAARAWLAFALVNLRYWSSVARPVRAQLRRWRVCAEAIEDPVLRKLALQKLSEEGFNAELAAMLATLAPRTQRRWAVEAIVALEVLYDYLDGLTEAPARERPQDGRRLFAAFTDAVAPWRETAGNYYAHHSRSRDCGYMCELVGAARRALARLPANAAVAEVLQRSAQRGAEAQLRIHAAYAAGNGQLERWAKRHASGTSLHWQEFLAGAACSVLAVHALVAAAADRSTTREQAIALDRIYLSISVLPTVLDSVVDYESDLRAGCPGYVRHYEDRTMLSRRLAGVIADVLARARGTPNGAHHVMTMTGVVAYYLSAPTAASAFARPVAEHARRQLRPLIAPMLAMLRSWRALKRWRTRVSGAPYARAGHAT
jgi:tetraprenyl-beta-curcumene synthase